MKPGTSRKTALILVDVQNGFLHPTHWGTSRSTPECERNIERLLRAARDYNSAHHSIDPDSQLHPAKQIEVDGKSINSVEPQSWAAPSSGETVWVKNVNSAFIGTGLEAFLKQNHVWQLVICELTTDHCVSTTTRMANNLRVVDIVKDNGVVVEEDDIILASDACATYGKGGFDAETIHQVNLASLNGEFAQVDTTANVLEAVFIA
ncbi:putative Isochorismatase-like domain-containing protein [Seiridium unicorne]|uniref:Isochorismatase-like domain-containing protein n=1 Tax=Seiridium unicorne TaxID=138068 RepID=A0ABR2VA31_9PEZI